MKPALRKLVIPIIQTFRKSAQSDRDYVQLIGSLKTAFETACGPRRERFDANEISLVVYSGPVKRDTTKCFRDSVPWMTPSNQNISLIPISRDFWPPPYPVENGRCATLFTGDITLDDPTFSDIEKHFTKPRLDFVAYFQVPHHGSKHSLNMTKTSILRHDYSVFSSARYHSRYDHPNASIVAALNAHGPLFVNEYQGFVTGGYIQSL